MDNYHIKIDRINKAFILSRNESLEVLKDFSLDVKKGEIVGIYGPNGCGKSTLLEIVAKTQSPDSGEVLVKNVGPSVIDVGYIMQDYSSSLFPWMSVAENIAFSLRLQGVSKKERLLRVLALKEKLNIAIDLTKYPYQLSGGQQQLVSLARALSSSPAAIVMDEPYSALDIAMRENVRAETMRIADALQLTAILVSHSLEDCIMCSDRVVFLTPRPARIYQIEEVPLSSQKHNREVHSDMFANILKSFQSIAEEACSQ